MQLHETPPIPLSFRIITFNIRYDCAPSAREPHELPFSERLPVILQTLYFHTLTTPSFICLQETLHHQLVAIVNGLNGLYQCDAWRYLGAGREDGKKAGEFNPILYRRDQWRCVESEQKWLSPTPEKPSYGWGAGCMRVFVRALFEPEFGGDGGKGGRRRISVVNTHFDHMSEQARELEARMVLKVLEGLVDTKEENKASEMVFLTGDLNSRVDQAAYKVLSGKGSVVKDAMEEARVTVGNKFTFTGFEGQRGDLERIDYVFVGGRGDRVVKSYAVGSNGWDEGWLMSDHRPVIVDVVSKGVWTE